MGNFNFDTDGNALKHQLMTDFDAMAGIGADGKGSKFNDHNTLVRIADCNQAHLKSPISNPDFKNNLARQRGLATARAIDYVLEKQGLNSNNEYRQKLSQAFTEFNADANPEVEQEKYYAKLAEVLRDAGLAPGCEDSHDFAKLLEFYRNMASLLDPAESVQTVITKNDPAGQLHTFTITQKPITEKTETQQQQINNFIDGPEDVAKYPGKRPGKFPGKASQRLAMAHFKELLLKDDRRLPEQCRHWIPMTAKNGYVVNLKHEKAGSAKVESATFIRVATPTMTGDMQGIDASQFVEANLDQIHSSGGLTSAKKHWFTMNFRRWENNIVPHLENAVKKRDDSEFNNTPRHMTVLFPSTLSKKTRKAAKDNRRLLSTRNTLSMQTARYNNVANLTSGLLKAQVDDNASSWDIPIVSCASARDRTGGAVELMEQDWMNFVAPELGAETIKEISAKSLNSAVIASVALPGAPFIKQESIGGLFRPDLFQYYANKVCDNNKAPKVGTMAIMNVSNLNKLRAEQDAAIVELLNLAGLNTADLRDSDGLLSKQFYNNLKQAQKSHSPFTKHTAQMVLAVMDVEVSTGMPKQEAINALKSITHLHAVTNAEIKDPVAINAAKKHCMAQAKQLQKRSWGKKLAIALVAVAAAVLLVAAGLGFIPSGGLTAVAYGAGAAAFLGSGLYAKLKPNEEGVGKETGKLAEIMSPKSKRNKH